MAKQTAYDRVRNADNRSDVFIKTPYWTTAVEAQFSAWCDASDRDGLEALLDGFLGQDVAVSFKSLEGSVCCTLAHQASKDADLPYLLTGWSDDCTTALYVAMYKLEIMMGGIWEQPPIEKAPRRR